MTDRELLENAAKAAGINLAPEGNEVGPAHFDGVGLVKYSNSGFVTFKWYPLTDDGDALRLAVKLGICFGPNFDGDKAVANGGEFSQFHAVEVFDADRYAATRRAIVRAAAAIGEALL